MQESMMLGLRLTREGLSKSEFQIRHQADMSTVFQKEIEKILQAGMAEWQTQENGEHLVLTLRGIMLGHRVFQEFV